MLGLAGPIGAGIGALGGLLAYGLGRSPEEERLRRAAELRKALSEMRAGRMREGIEAIYGQTRGAQAQTEMVAARRAAAEGRTDATPLSAPAMAEIARGGGQAILQLRQDIARQFDPLMAEVEMGVAARPIEQPFGEQLFDWVTDLGQQHFLQKGAERHLDTLRFGMEQRQQLFDQQFGIGPLEPAPLGMESTPEDARLGFGRRRSPLFGRIGSPLQGFRRGN